MLCFFFHFFCTELPIFCTKLPYFCSVFPKNCITLSQSESINFCMYIIHGVMVSVISHKNGKVHLMVSNVQARLTTYLGFAFEKGTLTLLSKCTSRELRAVLLNAA